MVWSASVCVCGEYYVLEVVVKLVVGIVAALNGGVEKYRTDDLDLDPEDELKSGSVTKFNLAISCAKFSMP